jgi:hypothetical protein
MEGCYTAEEWLARFKKLSPSEQFKLKASVEPKAKEEGAGTTIRLIIRGVKGWICTACGHKQDGSNDGAEGPVEGPLDDHDGLQAPPFRSAPPPGVDSRDSRIHGGIKTAVCESIPKKSVPVLDEEPPAPPPGTPIFTVPSCDDEDVRAELDRLPIVGIDEG